jgi:hypothetical protein
MNARIGAARAIDHGMPAVDDRHRALKNILHGSTPRLGLPAGEG